MKKKWSALREKIITTGWSFQLAWTLNKWVLLGWMTLSVAVSVLPAVSLIFHQNIVAMLSDYLSVGTGTFQETVPQMIGLGITMILIGVSARVNADLIYMMMYDSYYLGMEDILMTGLQRIEITDLLKRELNDEYHYIIGRAGSLADILSGACAVVGKLVSIVSLLVVAARTSVPIFFISLVYVLGILVLNFCFTEKVRWDTAEYREIARVADYYENLPLDLGAAKEIRLFRSADFLVMQWKKAYTDVKKYQSNREFGIELRNFISGVGFYIFLIVMIFYNLFMVARGEMDVSIFLVLFTLCLNIFTAISGLARDIMSFDYGLFALGRQRNFLKNAPYQKPEQANDMDKKENGSDVFTLKDVCFSYQGDEMTLKHISFSVKKGEVIAVLGHNGSGKTTLSKLLLGMYRPLSGKMELCGVPYENYSPNQIRRKIGVSFQDFYLFHAPLSENIGYGDIENVCNAELIENAIQKGGVQKIVAKLNNGIHTILGKAIYTEGAELSGGEKQRVAVARAYMNNKDIMILDEPASAVDPIAEAEQFLNIREKLKGRTAVLISHRVGFARMADRILMMDHGEIIEMGTHEELMAKQGAYAEFYERQAEWYENEKNGGMCDEA